MIAYRHPTISFTAAKGHEAFRRIAKAGPWAFAMHPEGGTLAYWKRADGSIATPADFGEPRACPDGLIYYPAKREISLADLADEKRAASPDCVRVSLVCGEAPILPAYLEPVKILSTGKPGGAATPYGAAAWAAYDHCKDQDDAGRGFSLIEPVILRACRYALLSCHPRLTDELWDDLGVLTDADVEPLLEAVWRGPEKKDPAASGPSPSPSPPVPSPTSH